ncbi:MAG: hypothetical protein C4K58_03725 [Flavobacteriaceae bacterium]|nr:MAG: hypothetical protein C4K58_03725 [Flavobacteriaceae bacterium]
MEIISVIENAIFDADKVHISPICSTQSTKEVQINFLPGQMMPAHKSKNQVIIQVLLGEIHLGIEGFQKIMRIGDVIVLKPDQVHDLEALQKSIIRLTIVLQN